MASANTFGDVPAGEWFAPYVRWANANGIMQGTGGGNFSPNAPMTRAQLVTILWRIDGEPTPTHIADFSDVASGQWYTDAVNWAASRSIVSGVGDGRFAPHDNISREQFATILGRWALSMRYLPNDFSDLSDELQEAFIGAFDPFDDDHTVSSWAVAEMRFLLTFGVIGGTGANTLNPQGIATRAQGAAMVARLVGVSHEYGWQVMPVPPMDNGDHVLPQPDPEPTPPVTDSQREFELEVLRLINIERVNAGATPFIWDESLAVVARAHSVDMATRGFFAHICPSGVSANDRINNGTRWSSGGECLAFGNTPFSAVQAWMNSPLHRTIILNDWGAPWMHFVGIGYYNQRWTLKTTMGTY